LVFKDEERCYIKGFSVDKLEEESKEHPESMDASYQGKLSPCGSWYAIASEVGIKLFVADTHEKIEDIKTEGMIWVLWTSTEYCVGFGLGRDDSYAAIPVKETAVSCSLNGRALPSPKSKLSGVVEVLQSKDRTLVYTGEAIYDTKNPNHRLELLSR